MMLPSMFLLVINLGDALGLLSFFVLGLILIPLSIYLLILTYKSYSHRKKIMKFQE